MKLLKRQTKDKKPKSGSGWGNPEVLDVNLIKDEIGVSFDWKKPLLKFFVMAALAAGFVAEIMFALGNWQKSEEAKAGALNSGFQEVNSELRNMKGESDSIVAFKDKLDLANQLVEKHIYWTNFFNWLEKKTLSSVTYGDFDGDTKGVYALSAKTNSYADISWQVKTFLEDSMTLKAKVESGTSSDSGSSDGNSSSDSNSGQQATSTATSAPSSDNSSGSQNVSFDLDLTVKPEIFYKK